MGMSELAQVEARISGMLAKAGPDLNQLRQLYDDLCDIAPVPEGLERHVDTIGGVGVEVIKPAADVGSGTVVYLHGGGHMVGSLASHRGLASRLAARGGLRVVVVDFRLAPEHPYPAALEDGFAVYKGLLEQGVPPEALTLAGDSAGGGLCLSVLLKARDEGLALPSAVTLFSPFVDLTGSAPSLQDNGAKDVLVSEESVHGTRAVYLPEGDARHPYVSPLFGDLTGFPPLLVHVGGGERLLDDALRISRRAGMDGVSVELKIWPDMPHVWQIFAPILKQGQTSIDEAAAFLKSHLS